MKRWVLGAAACGAVAIVALACEDIAHVSDFRVEDSVAAAPYHGPCNACPASTSLRHPPCPPAGEGAAGDDGQVHVYVWRKLYLGFSDAPGHELDPNAYDPNVGFNMDCSSRKPSGLPVQCKAIDVDGGLVPWAPYPQGIDNVYMQRVFNYLSKEATQTLGATPLDQSISAGFEKGGASVIDVVYHWNGTPNDSQVSFRVISSLGTVNGKKPNWDGHDEWIAGVVGPDPNVSYPDNFEIPLVAFATDNAYVTDGTLVADMSFLEPANTYIVNNGALLEVPIHDLLFTGRITDSELAYSTATGKESLNDFLQAVPDLANFLSGCNSLVSGVLCGTLPRLATQAADSALDPSTMAPSEPCSAISLAYGGDAYKAHIGQYESIQAAAGCPIKCPNQP